MQFPLVNAKAPYLQNIVVLTRSVRDNPSTGFCKCLENFGIKGQDFDAIKNDFCALRKPGQLPFCSVDCFIEAKGKYYFIEFKKSTTPGLNGIECHEGDPIGVSLRRKAFDRGNCKTPAETGRGARPARPMPLDRAVTRDA